MYLNLLITDEQFITANINADTTTLGYGCELHYEIKFEATNTNLDEIEALDYSELLIDYCETAIFVEASHPQFKAISRRLKTDVSYTYTGCDESDTVIFSKDLAISHFHVYEVTEGEEYEIGHESIGYFYSSQFEKEEDFWKLATGLGIQP